jgi:CDP-diacylglycerol---glycerol-3-phosphate 3-phosphatidyltransferase
MNLPNKITISRIILIPFFMIFALFPLSFGKVDLFGLEIGVNQLIAVLIFIIASATDGIDGYIARKHNLVTNLGKFLDPLADKLLTTAAFILLVDTNDIAGWMVIIILFRELSVTGLRLLAVEKGVVIAADKLGKLKTILQIVAISLIYFNNFPFAYIGFPLDKITLWLALIVTVISGYNYFAKNIHVFKDSK